MKRFISVCLVCSSGARRIDDGCMVAIAMGASEDFRNAPRCWVTRKSLPSSACAAWHQDNDYFRMERRDFGIEPRPASCYLPGAGFFVNAAFSSRFPFEVFYRICDVNFFAVNSCFRKRLIQE